MYLFWLSVIYAFLCEAKSYRVTTENIFVSESWVGNDYELWIEYWLVGVTGMTETGTNLQTSSMVVTDQETGKILDNADIQDGTKVKIQLEATITNELAGENIKVKLSEKFIL